MCPGLYHQTQMCIRAQGDLWGDRLAPLLVRTMLNRRKMKVVDIIQLDNIYAERVCDSSGWSRELILSWIEEFPARGT